MATASLPKIDFAGIGEKVKGQFRGLDPQDPAGEIEAVDPGEPEIDQRHIGPGFENQALALFPVRRGDDLKPFALKHQG